MGKSQSRFGIRSISHGKKRQRPRSNYCVTMTESHQEAHSLIPKSQQIVGRFDSETLDSKGYEESVDKSLVKPPEVRDNATTPYDTSQCGSVLAQATDNKGPIPELLVVCQAEDSPSFCIVSEGVVSSSSSSLCGVSLANDFEEINNTVPEGRNSVDGIDPNKYEVSTEKAVHSKSYTQKTLSSKVGVQLYNVPDSSSNALLSSVTSVDSDLEKVAHPAKLLGESTLNMSQEKTSDGHINSAPGLSSSLHPSTFTEETHSSPPQEEPLPSTSPEETHSSPPQEEPLPSTSPEETHSSPPPEEPLPSTSPEETHSSPPPEEPLPSTSPEETHSSPPPEEPLPSTSPEETHSSPPPEEPLPSTSPEETHSSSPPEISLPSLLAETCSEIDSPSNESSVPLSKNTSAHPRSNQQRRRRQAQPKRCKVESAGREGTLKRKQKHREKVPRKRARQRKGNGDRTKHKKNNSQHDLPTYQQGVIRNGQPSEISVDPLVEDTLLPLRAPKEMRRRKCRKKEQLSLSRGDNCVLGSGGSDSESGNSQSSNSETDCDPSEVKASHKLTAHIPTLEEVVPHLTASSKRTDMQAAKDVDAISQEDGNSLKDGAKEGAFPTDPFALPSSNPGPSKHYSTTTLKSPMSVFPSNVESLKIDVDSNPSRLSHSDVETGAGPQYNQSPPVVVGSPPLTSPMIVGSPPPTSPMSEELSPPTSPMVVGSSPATSPIVVGSSPPTSSMVVGSSPPTSPMFVGLPPPTSPMVVGSSPPTSPMVVGSSPPTSPMFVWLPPPTSPMVVGSSPPTSPMFVGLPPPTSPMVVGSSPPTSPMIVGSPPTSPMVVGSSPPTSPMVEGLSPPESPKSPPQSPGFSHPTQEERPYSENAMIEFPRPQTSFQGHPPELSSGGKHDHSPFIEEREQGQTPVLRLFGAQCGPEVIPVAGPRAVHPPGSARVVLQCPLVDHSGLVIVGSDSCSVEGGMSLLEAIDNWVAGNSIAPFYHLVIGLVQFRSKNRTWFGLYGGAESEVVVKADGVAIIPHTVVNRNMTDIRFLEWLVCVVNQFLEVWTNLHSQEARTFSQPVLHLQQLVSWVRTLNHTHISATLLDDALLQLGAMSYKTL